jgi:hypothetical protein
MICTLGRNVSAVQVSLSKQELKYPATVSPVQMQIFLTALNMGLANVEYVSVQRYGSSVLIHFFISLNLVGEFPFTTYSCHLFVHSFNLHSTNPDKVTKNHRIWD